MNRSRSSYLVYPPRKWVALLLLLASLFVRDISGLNVGEHKGQTSREQISRRSFLATSTILPFTLTGTWSLMQPPANALPFVEQKERRQKELCIVNVLRLGYWAETVASALETSVTDDERKKAYLEARLGAKAMVAEKNKIGGGATSRIFSLLSLQITACLDDLKYYAKNKKMDQYKEDLREALASIVEFDGLETTQDPSPRSTLTLAQYNDQKALYVRRMLSERIVPLTKDIVGLFGADTRVLCEGYVRDYYPNELPPKPKQPQLPIVGDTSEES
jgi:hypothetical protein